MGKRSHVARKFWQGPGSHISTISSPVVLACHPNTCFSCSLRAEISQPVLSKRSGSRPNSRNVAYLDSFRERCGSWLGKCWVNAQRSRPSLARMGRNSSLARPPRPNAVEIDTNRIKLGSTPLVLKRSYFSRSFHIWPVEFHIKSARLSSTLTIFALFFLFFCLLLNHHEVEIIVLLLHVVNVKVLAILWWHGFHEFLTHFFNCIWHLIVYVINILQVIFIHEPWW